MRLRRLLAVASFGFVVLVSASPAHAQAFRTWVSGVGDDVNPCSRTAPCKTFAGAISKTAAGGEINALDPAGYGAVTITKAITIDGGNQFASILAAGTNGINIQAGAGDTVTLRNLSINGVGTGLNGVRFISGLGLVIENVDVFGFTQNAVNIIHTAGAARVSIIDSDFTNNGGSGINVHPTAGASVGATFVRVRAVKNANGVVVDASNAGILNVSVESSEVGNSSGSGFQVTTIAGGGTSRLMIVRSTAASNNTGVGVSGASATALVSQSALFLNSTGFSNSGGTLLSYRNNNVFNINDGTATTFQPQ